MRMVRIYGLMQFGLFSFCAAHALAGIPMPAGMSNGSAPHLPFSFVENRGQASPRVRYIGSGPEFKAWFKDSGVVLQHGRTVVKIEFETGVTAKNPTIRADHPIGARANYLHGNDSRRWQTDLPLFGGIRYSGIWPGVELAYEADGDRMKAEYVVAPGAAVDRILLRFDGEGRVLADGSLRVRGSSGDFVEEAPVLYQTIHGERSEVTGGFRRLADGMIGFRAFEYDHTQPLVIDPSILLAGYFGGSSEDDITAIGVDGLNNIAVAGWTSSIDLPATNGARKQSGGGVDAFVASFLPNGGGLIYCTYLGGSGDDRAFGLAIDSVRNIYITGWTSSTNFPVAGAVQSHLNGTRDGFVTKLNAAGNALLYSTYLGGSGVDVGYAISLDQANEAVIVGDSTSLNLPVTHGVFQPNSGGAQDAFVAKLSSSGSALVFLTYLGGNGIDHGSSVFVGPSGGIVVGGYTWSNNFPTAGLFQAYQSTSGGGQDGFIVKLSADGTKFGFGTYLGGSGGSIGAPEEVNAVSIDSQGNITAAGTTSSANFPVTPGAFQTTFGGQTDGFISRFSSAGVLLQSTFLGGALSDGINALALDFHGVPYVTGFTDSQDFPVQSPIQSANAGGMDAFVVKLNTTLSAMPFGTYLGGYGSDGGNAIAVDFETSVIAAGQTSSGNFPIAGNLPNSSSEILSSFITKIAPAFKTGVAYGFQSQQIITTDLWHIASPTQSTVFGNATDLPIVGDWDGSGKKRIGIFRNGTWILDINGDGIIDAGDKTVLSFGQAGDIPVVGDWLGTGHISLGLFRQGTFILDLSGHLTGVPTGQGDATFPFGQAGDLPIVADWNGSGTTKVGVFLNGLWLVDYNGNRVVNGLNRTYTYGQAGDLPVVGDWDSSGRPSKIGIYRSGLWVLDYDGDNAWTVPYLNEMVLGFGFPGDTPLIF